MGYLDRQLTGSSGQALTDTGTVYSTDVIDLAASGRDISRVGAPMRALCIVGEDFASGGSGTLAVALVESANPDLSSPTVLYDSGAIGHASLTPGTRIVDALVPTTTKRYLGWRYIVATAAMTAGTVLATIAADTMTADADRPTGNTGL